MPEFAEQAARRLLEYHTEIRALMRPVAVFLLDLFGLLQVHKAHIHPKTLDKLSFLQIRGCITMASWRAKSKHNAVMLIRKSM